MVKVVTTITESKKDKSKKVKKADINIFDKILGDGIRKGIIPARTQKARNWFRDRATQVDVTSNKKIVSEADERARDNTIIGSMFLFKYDPKHKLTLPYYDTYPLIFPIDIQSDHFLGINLHYLPPTLRAKMMDSLYSIRNNSRYDESTKLKISYGILKNASKFKYFRPCIKMYLNNHVRTQFVKIEPAEWDIALFLPLARFKKQTIEQVWQDSEKIINKTRKRSFWSRRK